MKGEEQIRRLEERIKAVEDRNLRVEADKAWETSTFRILSITVITYLVASVVLYFIGVEGFFLSALIPAVGYFLSMRTLPGIKKWWIEKSTGDK